MPQALFVNARWFVYALRSTSQRYTYVGMTTDILDRVDRHNGGREKTTKPYRPFELMHLELAKDSATARQREKFWKSGRGKEILAQIRNPIAQVAESVDALVSNTSDLNSRAGSSPALGTEH